MKKEGWSLKSIIILFGCGVVAFSLLITDLLTSKTVANLVEENQMEKARNASRMVAYTPFVAKVLAGEQEEPAIQSFTNKVQQATDVQFVVVMDMEGIRKSHPDPDKIGKPFAGGDEHFVLKGEEYISRSEGTLGPSLRSFTPIFAEDGKQVGAVAVGISLDDVEKAVSNSRNDTYMGTIAGIFAGIIGAVLLASYIKKVLLGLEPVVISRLLEERNAMLESVHEGIIAVDRDSNITLMNKAALKLFRENSERAVPLDSLKKVMEEGNEELDREQYVNGGELLVNSVPIRVEKTIVGAIATYRDKTEIKQLAEQLTGARLYADALRAQAHEFMNKLHVILGMVQMKSYDELASFINEIVDHKSNEIQFVTNKIKDPVLAGFFIGKLSYARESGADLYLASDYPVPEAENPGITNDLITIIGNLIDNAIDAVSRSPQKRIDVFFDYGDAILTIQVKDTGVGMDSKEQDYVFDRGFTTKGADRGIGLSLLKETIKKLEGDFDIVSEKGKGTVFTVYLPFDQKGEKK